MIRRRMVIALVAALSLSTATFVYLARNSETGQVVVTAVELPAGSLIDSKSVRLIGMNRESVHPAAFRRLEDVTGKYSIQTMVAGEQVLKHRVAAGEYGGVVSGLAGDLRAMFLPVDDSRAVGGSLKRGGRVDVVFVSGDQRNPSVAKCVLASVPVLQPGMSGDRIGAAGRDGGIPGAIVAVTPGDAEKLAFCLENGKVYLIAVPYGSSPSSSPGVTWKDVFAPDASTSP